MLLPSAAEGQNNQHIHRGFVLRPRGQLWVLQPCSTQHGSVTSLLQQEGPAGRRENTQRGFSAGKQVLQCGGQARNAGGAVPGWLCWGAASQHKSKRSWQKVAIPRQESIEKEQRQLKGATFLSRSRGSQVSKSLLSQKGRRELEIAFTLHLLNKTSKP